MRKEIAMIHSKLETFAFRVNKAKKIIENALNCAGSPYVALSGGKDSTVVYALVREYIPSVISVWSDDEWFLPETIEYVERLRKNGGDVRQIRTEAVHSDWFKISGNWDGIQDYAHNNGFDCVFLGLRQEESATRRIHLQKMGSLFFAKKDRFWHCNPIYDWSWRDVWAYIVSNGLDYNKAYDKLEAIGVAPKNQRIGPLAVDRVLGYGQIAILKKGWPDLYNLFVEKYPQARSYT